MDQIDLIVSNYLQLMALHEANSNFEKDEKRKAYLVGVANGVRIAMQVFTTTFGIDDQVPIPSYPIIHNNPYSWDE